MKLSELRVVDLKSELDSRNLESNGLKLMLVQRLKEHLEENGHDPQTYDFQFAKSPTKEAPNSQPVINTPVRKLRRSLGATISENKSPNSSVKDSSNKLLQSSDDSAQIKPPESKSSSKKRKATKEDTVVNPKSKSRKTAVSIDKSTYPESIDEDNSKTSVDQDINICMDDVVGSPLSNSDDEPITDDTDVDTESFKSTDQDVKITSDVVDTPLSNSDIELSTNKAKDDKTDENNDEEMQESSSTSKENENREEEEEEVEFMVTNDSINLRHHKLEQEKNIKINDKIKSVKKQQVNNQLKNEDTLPALININKEMSNENDDHDKSKDEDNIKDCEVKDNIKDGEDKDNIKDGEDKDNIKDGEDKDNIKDGEDKDNIKDGDVKDKIKDGEDEDNIKDGEDIDNMNGENDEDIDNMNGENDEDKQSIDFVLGEEDVEEELLDYEPDVSLADHKDGDVDSLELHVNYDGEDPWLNEVSSANEENKKTNRSLSEEEEFVVVDSVTADDSTEEKLSDKSQVNLIKEKLDKQSEKGKHFSGCNLWVHGITKLISTKELADIFKPFDEVLSVKFVSKKNDSNTILGYVTLASPAGVLRALCVINGYCLKGATLCAVRANGKPGGPVISKERSKQRSDDVVSYIYEGTGKVLTYKSLPHIPVNLIKSQYSEYINRNSGSYAFECETSSMKKSNETRQKKLVPPKVSGKRGKNRPNAPGSRERRDNIFVQNEKNRPNAPGSRERRDNISEKNRPNAQGSRERRDNISVKNEKNRPNAPGSRERRNNKSVKNEKKHPNAPGSSGRQSTESGKIDHRRRSEGDRSRSSNQNRSRRDNVQAWSREITGNDKTKDPWDRTIQSNLRDRADQQAHQYRPLLPKKTPSADISKSGYMSLLQRDDGRDLQRYGDLQRDDGRDLQRYGDLQRDDGRDLQRYSDIQTFASRDLSRYDSRDLVRYDNRDLFMSGSRDVPIYESRDLTRVDNRRISTADLRSIIGINDRDLPQDYASRQINPNNRDMYLHNFNPI